jgi:phosphatidylglycerol:prolipoprotein diacylglycerol transferase
LGGVRGQMQFVIPFPDLDPEIFSVSFWGIGFALRWYALAYIVGILIGLGIVLALMRRPALWPGDTAPMRPAEVEGLLTWIVLGVILGGRLGFVLFYQPGHFLDHPMEILAIWQGGMSFHGGMLGVVVALVLYGWRNRLPVIQVADAVAVATPPGLLLGRIANFINGELWGRPTTVPWAVAFPDPLAQLCPAGWEGPCGRHPSQLYEAGLEGLVLGAALLWLATRRGGLKVPGQMVGLFLAGYGAARMFVEGFRQADAPFITPDNPFGHVIRFGTNAEAWGLTMGQLLSLPMLILGLLIIVVARWRAARPRPA